MEDVIKALAHGTPHRKNVPVIVSDLIREKLLSGQITSGAKFPSEPELAKSIGISRNTLRDALNILQQDGLLIRRQGVGTFAAEKMMIENRLDINLGVTEFIQSSGQKPGVSDVLFHEKAASKKEGNLLAVAVGEKLIEVDRVRTADGLPVVFSKDIFSKNLLQQDNSELSLETLRLYLLQKQSLYKFLEEELSLNVEYSLAEIKAAVAEGYIADRLSVKEGTLLIHLEQVDFDKEGRPILLSDEFHFLRDYSLTIIRRRKRRHEL